MRERLPRRLDRFGAERAARAAGLPDLIAARIAAVVVQADLPESRRAEVLRELIAHFEDGLAAGRTPADLLAAFGDGDRAARLIREAKRVVTPAAAGGTGTESRVARLGRDLRYAGRRLLARPGFTAVAVLSLALGIGANTALFTVVNEVALARAPLREPERLVDVYSSNQESPFAPLSYPDLEELARRTDAFEAVTGTRLYFASRVDGDRPERVAIQLVTGNYFGTLGIRPAVGRLIEPGDTPAPGAGMVVVLGHRYWRTAFGGDPGVVGRELALADGRYQIVGVLSPEFDGGFRGLAAELYLPYTRINHLGFLGIDGLTSRNERSTFARARLAPGVTLAAVRTVVEQVARDLRDRREPGWEGNATFTVIPSADVIVYPPVDRILTPLAAMLLAVVGLVLLIACANLAGFLLARAVDRRRELAVRLSLGATRGQLVAQLLAETALLGLLGGGFGLVLARVALQALLAVDLPIPVPLAIDLDPDWRVLGFLVSVSLGAGLLAGLAPALQATRFDIATVIRDESTGGGRAKGALRSALVAGQVAVAVVLLIAAGLFLRSLDAVRRSEPGFGSAPTALLWLGAPTTIDTAEARRRLELVERRLAELPGVQAVGFIENIHLNPLSTSTIELNIAGIDPPPGEIAYAVDRATIDSGFVGAAGLRLIRGRNVAPTDDGSAPLVALVNEAFGARFWPGQDPVGRRFRNRAGNEVEVVGLVSNAAIRNFAEEPRPFVYTSLAQSGFSLGWLVVRGEGDEDALLAAAVRATREAAPDLMQMETRTMRRHFALMALPIRLAADLLAGFAGLALVMAVIGLYGTVSYAVAQRSREVGIRLSLGADRWSVIRLLVWGGFRLVLVGGAIGLVLGVLFGRLLEGLLVGVTALDPATLLAVPALLGAVTAVAAWIPARRAGRIDPVSALRAE